MRMETDAVSYLSARKHTNPSHTGYCVFAGVLSPPGAFRPAFSYCARASFILASASGDSRWEVSATSSPPHPSGIMKSEPSNNAERSLRIGRLSEMGKQRQNMPRKNTDWEEC